MAVMGFQDDPGMNNSLPLGLAMGMAMNEQALDHYGRLTEYEKEKLIAESRGVKSKEEMEKLIQRLGDGDLKVGDNP